MHKDRADNIRCNLDKPDSLCRVDRLADHDRVDTTVVALVVVVSMPVQGTVVVQIYTLAVPGFVAVDRAHEQAGTAGHLPDRRVAHLLHAPGEKTAQTLVVAVRYPCSVPVMKER